MIEFVDMKLSHAYDLAPRLRAEDVEEVEALGFTPRQSLRKNFYESCVRKTIMVDGEVAACFGLRGTIVGETGHIWLLTSHLVEGVYLALASAYRKQMREFLEIYPRLENYCLASYTKSLGLMKLSGFTVHDPQPFGPRGVLFCRFEASRGH